MLKQAKGLPTPEGYAIITRPFADFLIKELERLYDIEDEHMRCGVLEETAVDSWEAGGVVDLITGAMSDGRLKEG